MARAVRVTVHAEYEDTIDVVEDEQNLTDNELKDKYSEEATLMLKEAVAHDWHEITSVDVEIVDTNA